MKIKFVLVNTDKSIEIETFNFELNTFEEFKKKVSDHWSGGEEIEGFAYAILAKHKNVSKTLDSFDSNDEGKFPISTTIRYSKDTGVTTIDAGNDFSYKDHNFFKQINNSSWEKYELEFTEDLFNFYLTKS